jgi:hypothetical protein
LSMLRNALALLACVAVVYIFVSGLRVGLPRLFKWIITAGPENE